ncbi:unnamed protein product [Amoebophrya sp. A25]|nr:unnamed protein product [Amoebophrya sp. A25]|eukprot:GSA25T00008685001.1
MEEAFKTVLSEAKRWMSLWKKKLRIGARMSSKTRSAPSQRPQLALYQTVSGAFYFLQHALVLLASVQQVSGNDPNCWMGHRRLSYNFCCLQGGPNGNRACWDGLFNYNRCCNTFMEDMDDLPATPHELSERQRLKLLNITRGGYKNLSQRDRDALSVHHQREVGEKKLEEELSLACASTMYQQFKFEASNYYNRNQTHWTLLQTQTYIMGSFQHVAKVCAPAAIQALLLKMELIHFRTDGKFEDAYRVYTEQFMKAVALGRIEQSHYNNGWPLRVGLKRVMDLRYTQRVLPDALDVVVCYCQEDLDWLSVFWKLPFSPEDDHSDIVKNFVNLRILHKCPQYGEDQERARLVNRWQGYFREFTVDFITDYLRADDCSAYLGYILLYYDRLPKHTIFLHADVGEHIPHLNMVTDLMLAASQGFTNNLHFAHLAHNYVKLGEGAQEMKKQCQEKQAQEVEHQLAPSGGVSTKSAAASSTRTIASGGSFPDDESAFFEGSYMAGTPSSQVGSGGKTAVAPRRIRPRRFQRRRSVEMHEKPMTQRNAKRSKRKATASPSVLRGVDSSRIPRVYPPAERQTSSSGNIESSSSRRKKEKKEYLSSSELGSQKIQEMSIFSRFCRKETGPNSDVIADDYEWPRLWKNVFQSSVAPSPVNNEVNAYCCVQFVVSRDRIKLRPKSFYEHAFEHLRSEDSYLDLFPSKRYVRNIDVRGRTPCQLHMYFWHAYFGVELSMERRQYDPQVPYFLKATNLEREIYDESIEAGLGQMDGVLMNMMHMASASNPTAEKRIYWESQVHNW